MAAGLGRVGLLIAGMLVTTACVSGTADPTTTSSTAPRTTEPAPTSTTTTTAPTTTTEPAPVTSRNPEIPITDPAADPPVLVLVASTWEELLLTWESMDRYWTWLHAHPSVDKTELAALFHPDGPEFQQQLSTMAGLIDEGFRIVASTAFGQPLSVGCCPDPQSEMDTGAITLTITTTAPDGAVWVNASGDTVRSVDGWVTRDWRLRLVRIDDEWFVWSLEVV